MFVLHGTWLFVLTRIWADYLGDRLVGRSSINLMWNCADTEHILYSTVCDLLARRVYACALPGFASRASALSDLESMVPDMLILACDRIEELTNDRVTSLEA